MIGTAGSSNLAVLPSGVAITLMDPVPFGGVAVTTVYAAYDSEAIVSCRYDKARNI